MLDQSNAPDADTYLQMKNLGITDFQMYLKLQQMGVKTPGELHLIQELKAPDVSTAELVQKGNFPQYEIYQQALLVGAKTYDEYRLVKMYQAPDLVTALKIKARGFPDYQTYQRGHHVGAKTWDELQEVEEYGAPNLEITQEIRRGGFPDYQTYQKASMLGVGKYNEYKLIQRYKAPDFETALKIKEGNYPDYQTYQQAQRVGAHNLSQFELIQRYNTPNYTIAKEIQCSEYVEKLNHLERSEYEWDFLRVAKHLSVPINEVSSILQELLEAGLIEGKFNSAQDTFISVRPTERELRIVNDFINRIRVGIPVSINRISEKTRLDVERCERIIKDLTLSSENAGEYLDFEGVFVKSEESVDILRSILKRYDTTEEKMAGVPFFCQVDGSTHPATAVAYQCTSCARYVCSKCYNDLSLVGRAHCPMCDSVLQLSK